MAKKKVKVNETALEYRKQRKRVQNFIRRNEKRGFVFSENVLPGIPKKITKASVRRLAKLTPEELYKKSKYVSPETGEVLKQEEARKMFRKKSAKKAQETRKRKKDQSYKKSQSQNKKDNRYNLNTDSSFFARTVIYIWKAELNKFAEGGLHDLLLAWMNSLIFENGEENTAKMIQTAQEDGIFLTWEVVYKESEAYRYMASLIDYMPQQGVMYKEEQLDKLEYMKRLDSSLEENESWESYD